MKIKLVIFDIDVQGHEAVRKRLRDITTSVFITTPTLSILQDRLYKRSTDSVEVIQKRIEMAKREVQRINEYDFLVINDNLDEAAKMLVLIAKSARLKTSTEEVNEFIQNWEF